MSQSLDGFDEPVKTLEFRHEFYSVVEAGHGIMVPLKEWKEAHPDIPLRCMNIYVAERVTCNGQPVGNVRCYGPIWAGFSRDRAE